MKKNLTLQVLALFIALSMSTLSVFADDATQIDKASTEPILTKSKNITNNNPILISPNENSNSLETEEISENLIVSRFASYSGIIKTISKGDNSTTLLIEGDEDNNVMFIISNDTYIGDDVKLEEGEKVVGYYDVTKPMTLIFPPQYNIEVLSSQTSDTNEKVDKFDNELISIDNFLKLNLSTDTKIVLKDGIKMELPEKIEEKDLKTLVENLANRKLLVQYTVSTRSIPAQTSPVKIVVLSEKLDDTTESIPNETQVKPEKNYFIVNGFKLENIDMHVTDDGYVMVPLRAICEGIDYKISWNQESQSITINEDISLSIGKTLYKINADETIDLEVSPILIENMTYVPMSFINLIANVAVN